MKNGIKSSIVMALLLAFTVSFANASDHVLKKDISKEWIGQSQISTEIKEAYKVDDAEYTVGIISKSNLGSQLGRSEGIALLGGIALLMGFFKRNPLITCLGLFAVATLFFNAPESYAVLAATPFAIKLKKDGLKDDELKFMNDLESRFEKIEIKGLDEDEIKKLQTKAFEEAFEPYKKLKEISFDKIIELLDEKTGFKAIALAQADEINKLKGGVTEKSLSLRDQVAAWQTKNKDVIAKIKSGNKQALESLEPFQFKAAASPMTPANTISDTVSFSAGSIIRMGAEIFDLRRIAPTFWDYIPKAQTGLENLPWVNKKVPSASGAAGFIGPGVAKPGVSFTLEVENSNAKKVAVSLKTVTELIDDVDGFTDFVNNELKYQLDIKTSSTLMTGVASSTVPAGVQTFSLGFTTSGLSTVNPNNWDCCRAIIAQIRLAFINSPVILFMNPVDMANMDMEKAISQGTYLGLNARPIPGGLIVEDLNIAAGQVQAVALDCLKTKIYKDFILKFGLENDDFTKNLITAIAERRIHFYHSENDAAGFVYDDFADIKSQIAAA